MQICVGVLFSSNLEKNMVIVLIGLISNVWKKSWGGEAMDQTIENKHI